MQSKERPFWVPSLLISSIRERFSIRKANAFKALRSDGWVSKIRSDASIFELVR